MNPNCKMLETAFTYSPELIGGLEDIIKLFDAKDSSYMKILKINLKYDNSYPKAKMMVLDKSNSIALYECKDNIIVEKKVGVKTPTPRLRQSEIELGSFHFFCGNNIVSSIPVVILIKENNVAKMRLMTNVEDYESFLKLNDSRLKNSIALLELISQEYDF